jgi:hypothetical protein
MPVDDKVLEVCAKAVAIAELLSPVMGAVPIMKRHRKMAEAAIEAYLKETQGWRPISEAPKEVTRMIAYGSYGGYAPSIEVIEYGENWCSHGNYLPTHFMLLPTPPIKE